MSDTDEKEPGVSLQFAVYALLIVAIFALLGGALIGKWSGENGQWRTWYPNGRVNHPMCRMEKSKTAEGYELIKYPYVGMPISKAEGFVVNCPK